jgi:Zn-dependent metalloprotease
MAHHTIVPPFLLERVAERGTPAQRDWALATLAADRSMRPARASAVQARIALAAPRPPAESGAPAKPTPRVVYDAGGRETVPGRRVRQDGDPATGDAAVDEAWEAMGATDDFLREALGRRSLDGTGGVMEAVVHYGRNYVNAFWDGQRIVCGDGDGELFGRFTKSLDVVAHELGHGVVDHEAAFEYRGQPGALNESAADVVGVLTRQHHLGQKAVGADWLVGADILGPEVEGQALRSMAAPGTAYDDDVLGKDPQPAHMDAYVVTDDDDGGVHINSGIPNHAFYTAATELGGFAWERAGRIWYETLRDPDVSPTSDFKAFAAAAARVAGRLFGARSEERAAVVAGWAKVGVTAG